MVTAPDSTLMILSHERYEKGNLGFLNRLLRFAAVRPKHRENLTGVSRLHSEAGSLPRNKANLRTSIGMSPMNLSSRFTRPCAACGGSVARIPRRVGRGVIWLYRHSLSPLVGYNCRHLPTCSIYGDEALDRFGLWAGGWMTLARLLRCQPWGTSGIDNVCSTLPRDARWYLPWRYARWRSVNDARPERPDH